MAMKMIRNRYRGAQVVASRENRARWSSAGECMSLFTFKRSHWSALTSKLAEVAATGLCNRNRKGRIKTMVKGVDTSVI
jgi:hypothetical protein